MTRSRRSWTGSGNRWWPFTAGRRSTGFRRTRRAQWIGSPRSIPLLVDESELGDLSERDARGEHARGVGGARREADLEERGRPVRWRCADAPFAGDRRLFADARRLVLANVLRTARHGDGSPTLRGKRFRRRVSCARSTCRASTIRQVDGYAVRAGDVGPANGSSASRRRAAPASPPVGPGEAVRISTGAPLPQGDGRGGDAGGRTSGRSKRSCGSIRSPAQ